MVFSLGMTTTHWALLRNASGIIEPIASFRISLDFFTRSAPVLASSARTAELAKTGAERVKKSNEILKEAMGSIIPLAFLNKAQCVVVIPSEKTIGYGMGYS